MKSPQTGRGEYDAFPYLDYKLLPVATFAAIVGYFLVEEQRETFRRGAEERTRALLTAVDAELRGSIDTIEALSQVTSLAEDDWLISGEAFRKPLDVDELLAVLRSL